jgi:hypothetical protein
MIGIMPSDHSFVPPALEKIDRQEGVGKPFPWESLLLTLRDERTRSLCFLVGEGSLGKTSLCEYLSNVWGAAHGISCVLIDRRNWQYAGPRLVAGLRTAFAANEWQITQERLSPVLSRS